MAKHELLNNVHHKDLRIVTKKKAEYGDNVNGSLILPAEFIDASKEYPIYFQKNAETGAFQVVVIFGFKQDENLFLGENGWEGEYIPALIRREPFLIGFQTEKGTEKKTPMIHIDMDSPRISRDGQGERVFLENGGNSPYLEEISKLLSMINDGIPASKAMIDVFLKYELIEQFTLDITFNDGTQYKTNSFYTIHQEKLLALDDATIGQLHRGGYLQLAYIVLESLRNIKRLISRQNERIATSVIKDRNV